MTDLGNKTALKPIIIRELNRLGITKTKDGGELRSADYYALRGLLAVERAVQS